MHDKFFATKQALFGEVVKQRDVASIYIAGDLMYIREERGGCLAVIEVEEHTLAEGNYKLTKSEGELKLFTNAKTQESIRIFGSTIWESADRMISELIIADIKQINMSSPTSQQAREVLCTSNWRVKIFKRSLRIAGHGSRLHIYPDKYFSTGRYLYPGDYKWAATPDLSILKIGAYPTDVYCEFISENTAKLKAGNKEYYAKYEVKPIGKDVK